MECRVWICLVAASLLLLGGVCGAKRDPLLKVGTKNKINGGDVALPKTQYRWTVWLQYNSSYVCGGALINKRYVITAANCVDEKRERGIFVYVGDYSSEVRDPAEARIRASEVYIHPDYNQATLENNIAIIELSTNAEYSQGEVEKIRLAKSSTFDQFVNVEGVCYVSGWGYTRRGELNEDLSVVETTLRRDGRCRGDGFDPSSNLCYETLSGGVCEGDEGAPIACFDSDGDPILLGINSVGTCRRGNQIGTDVATFLSWARGVMDEGLGQKLCRKLPPVNNGMFVVEEDGNSATLVCDSGVILNSEQCSTSITCTDREWVVPADLCTCGCSVIGRSFLFHIPAPAPKKNTEGIVIITTLVNVTMNIRYTRLDGFFEENITTSNLFFFRFQNLEEIGGIQLSSNGPITVYAEAVASSPTRPSNGGTMIHPTSCAGTLYKAVTPSKGGKKAASQITVLGVNEDTTVNITSSTKSYYSGGSVTVGPFQPYIITGDDLTGLVFEGDGPIVVLSSHDCANIPSVRTGLNCDFVFEELPPVKSLFNAYIFTQLSPRPDVAIRILAVDDDTMVTIRADSGFEFHQEMQMKESFFGTFPDINMFSVTANQPILAAQFGINAGEDSFGDPSMFFPIGLGRFERIYYFGIVPGNSAKTRVILVIEESFDPSGLLINNEAINIKRASSMSVPGYGRYVFTSVSVRDIFIVIRHTDDVPFGAVFYQSNENQETATALGGIW